MGIAWCRERVEQAQNSKSPVDRILVRCSNLIKPKSPYSQSHGKITHDFVYKGIRTRGLGLAYPVPIHAVPPRARHRVPKSHGWHTPNLVVSDSKDFSRPPIPPPRKKRKRKINSTEVLNSELPKLCSPSYVIHSENLRNKTFSNMKATEKKETDVLHPFEKSYCRERSSGQDRFGKLSGNRMRKIKTESYPNDAKKKRIKNDNEKKTERKIKHVSTVSLPNYNELIKRNRKVSADMENGDDKNGNQSVGLKLPRRNSSTISLPGEGSNSILSSLSEATIHCLETYMKRCRSFGSLKPQQLLEKLEEFNKTQRSASESSDSWCGLDEWDLAVIEYCDPETSVPPPKPAPPRKQERCTFILGDDSFNMNRNRSGRESKVDSQIEQSKESPSNLDGKSEIKVLVPLEWFLDPKRRPPVILPIARESHNQKRLKAPPSSPESEGKGSTVNSPRESIKDAREHSSLLKILKQYKEDESEQEVRIDVRELVNEVLDDSQKDSMNFDEVDVEFSSKSNLNPFVSMKNRSNSFGEEKIRTSSLEGSTAARSSSLGLECSTLLLRQLQNNWEEIQREILLRPNELLNRLRRESLLRSLPKDAFEAFEKKKTTALRESLNEFLGFTDSTESAETDNKDSTKGSKEEKPNDDQERIRIEKEEEAKEKKEDEKIESHLIPESPFSLNPFKTAINSPEAEKSASNPDNLVTLKDIVGPF